MDKLIANAKRKLISKFNKKGLYENFGDKEVRELLDNKKCNAYGTSEQRENHNKVMDFDKWAMNFNG